jgi:hypothetical protein
MEPHSALWHYLWIAPHILQAVVVGIMIARGLQREFPVFLTYLAVDCAENVVLFVADHASSVSSDAYWWMMWVATVSVAILRFGVIYEIARYALGCYPGLERMGRLLLRWTAVGMLLLGVVVAARTPPNINPPLMSGIRVVTCVVDLIQAGMVVSFFLFAGYFGITMRSFVFGITLGLGLMASVSLAVLGAGMTFPANTYQTLVDLVLMATYHICVLVWLFYALAPVTQRRQANVMPENNLQRWNAELERLLMR